MQYSMPPLQPSDRPTSEGSDGSGSDESSSEEEVSYQSCVECSSDAHSVGSDEAYGCESASASDGEAAGDELQQMAAAPRSYRPTASAALIARLATFGIRLAPRLPSERECAFRTWIDEKAAETLLELGGGGAAAADTPTAATAAPAPPRVPLAPSPTLSASSSRSTPTLGTGDYELAPPPALPLDVAAPGPALDAQVAELMGRDPAAGVALAQAIFRHLPTGSLAAEADRVFGPAPPMVDGADAEVEGGRTQGGEAQPPVRLSVASTAEGAMNQTFTQREPCDCCDEFGRTPGVVGRCDALAMLDTLGGEFDEREGIVEEELAEGHDLEVTRRHARWFMYRTFVAHRYGYLGKGVRVTLPNCVIAEIRSRFRAPDCDCAWDALATCTEHGYRGHRSY
jgi:hypothetical protein